MLTHSLALCASPSRGDSKRFRTGKGDVVLGIWVITSPGAYRVPHITAHLEGFVPAGGNVAMLDGHVQWHNFSEMKLRTSSAQTFFYW